MTLTLASIQAADARTPTLTLTLTTQAAEARSAAGRARRDADRISGVRSHIRCEIASPGLRSHLCLARRPRSRARTVAAAGGDWGVQARDRDEIVTRSREIATRSRDGTASRD